jgi:raffinose/stachyose/melibiose transport system substrate-binding protein
MWQRSFQMLLDMKNAGCFPPHPEGMGLADVAGLVSSGKAVMLLDNSAQLAGMQAANPGMNVLDSTFALPAETAGQTRVLVYVSPVIGINNSTTNRGAALAFLDFLAQADQNKLFNDASAQVSPAAAIKGQLPTWGAGLSTYFKANKTISNPSATWPNPNLTITLLADLTGLFTGQKTVDALLKDMDAGWNG